MASSEVSQISDIYGGIGKYQIISMLVLVYIEIIMGMMVVFPVFMFTEVILHWDWNLQPNITYFTGTDCKDEEILQLNISSGVSSSTSRLIYESKYSSNSLTEKYGLICESSWLVSLTKSYSTLGTVIGSFLIGRLTERFGRRRISLCFLCLGFVSNLCLLFSSSYVLFSIACVTYGIAMMPAYSTFLIQVLENVPNSQRALLGTIGRYGMAIGQALLAGVSWVIKDWFYVQTFQTASVAVCIPISWYILDSPVWLMIKGRKEDSKENIIEIAKRNGQDLQDSDKKADLWILTMKAKNAVTSSEAKGEFTDLFKNRVISKYTCLITICSSITQFCMGCVLFNTDMFGSGLYEDYLISSAMLIVGIIIAAIVLTKYSIKGLQITCFILAGLNGVVYVFTYQFDLARLILVSVLRGILTAANCTIFVYAAEIFPTSVRVVGTGFLVFFSIASMAISPFAKELGEKTDVYVPFILIAVLEFSGAILMCFLPDTKNKPLVHNVDDLIK